MSASVFKSDNDTVVVSYIWNMDQTHRISNEFTEKNWREHTSIVDTMSYYVFQYMVPLSFHKALQDDTTAFKRSERDR